MTENNPIPVEPKLEPEIIPAPAAVAVPAPVVANPIPIEPVVVTTPPPPTPPISEPIVTPPIDPVVPEKKSVNKKLIFGILGGLAILIILLIIAVNSIFGGISKSSNKSTQTQIPQIGNINSALLATEVVSCLVVNNDGTTTNEDCQAYGEAGWHVSARGDTRIFFCEADQGNQARSCFYSGGLETGNPAQKCLIADDGTLEECEKTGILNQFVSTRGDTIKYQCANSAFPIAADCEQVREVNACDVQYANVFNKVPCKATQQNGWYDTTAGDTRKIYCLAVNGFVAEECVYADSGSLGAAQWCQRQDGSFRECEETEVPGKFVTTRGDELHYTCANSASPIASDCTEQTSTPSPTVSASPTVTATTTPKPTATANPTPVLQKCMVSTYGTWIEIDCKQGVGMNKYQTPDGAINIYCVSPSTTQAKECVYLNGPGSAAQWCKVGTVYQPCSAKGVNLYESSTGDPVEIYCTNSATPVATGCEIRKPVSSCRVYQVESWKDVNCTRDVGMNRFVTTQGDPVYMYCVNPTSPKATDCLALNGSYGSARWCKTATRYWECSYSDHWKQWVAQRGDLTLFSCTNVGDPLLTGCTITNR